MRNLIYAFDRSFEMALAALAAPLVGWIAEHYFGFKVCDRETMPEGTRGLVLSV